MLRRIAILGAISLAMASAGCGAMANACDVASPLIQKAQIYGDDAEVALHRAETTFASMNLDEAAKREVQVQIDRAWEALRAAQASLMAAADGCRGADAFTVFRDFITIWKSVEGLLAKHSSQLQSSQGLDSMRPAIVSKAEAK